MIDYEEPEIKASDLGSITQLAQSMREAQHDVEEYERLLKNAKDHLRSIQEDLLPTALQEVGMASFTMSDGTAMKLRKELYMSVPKKNMQQVCGWLIDHKHESLVRTNLGVDFGAGEREQAQQAEALLASHGYDHVQVNTAVHTGQLKSAVREMLAQGIDVPLDLMGGYEKTFVKIED